MADDIGQQIEALLDKVVEARLPEVVEARLGKMFAEVVLFYVPPDLSPEAKKAMQEHLDAVRAIVRGEGEA